MLYCVSVTINGIHMARTQKFGWYYYNEVEKDYVKNCNEETKNVYQILAPNFVERIDQLACKNPCSTLQFTPILDTIDHNFNNCEEPEDFYCMVSPDKLGISRNTFLLW